MEAAGWRIARCAGPRAAVVCGAGNNAGDGLAAARHLHRWGRLAAVSCVNADNLRGAAAKQLESLRKLGIEVSDAFELADATMVVDAIFGTGLSRPPEGKYAEWIEAINAAGKDVLAVDVPSGLDADSGIPYPRCVRAGLTVTLGLPKPGLSKVSGHVLVADIGVPVEAYAAVGIAVPPDLFAGGDLIPL